MDIVDRIRQLSNARNMSITSVEHAVGLGNGTIGKWKKQSPSCEKIKLVADYLSTTIDYLVTGQNAFGISADEQELISYYKKLPEREKQRLIGRAAALSEVYEEQHQSESFSENPNVYTAIIAARSTNNAPPRIETGDFSDILNAPDSTDDYK